MASAGVILQQLNTVCGQTPWHVCEVQWRALSVTDSILFPLVTHLYSLCGSVRKVVTDSLSAIRHAREGKNPQQREKPCAERIKEANAGQTAFWKN